MAPQFEVTDSPIEADKVALLDGLRAYNRAAAGMDVRPIAVWARDDDGRIIGGLTGRTGGDWLFIEFFWLPENMRGQGVGSELIRRAEAEAVARGCIGSWLDTYSFQAPGFYERHGYEVFGVVEDYPGDARRYFMKKRLDRPAG